MNTTIQRKTTTLPLLIAIALLFVRCPAFAAPNNNTNLGFGSLPSNTDGEFNTGIGFKALNMNLDGNNNTAIGARALAGFNTGGGGNAALGVEALVRLTRGIDNTAIGNAALWNLTAGNFNIAATKVLMAIRPPFASASTMEGLLSLALAEQRLQAQELLLMPAVNLACYRPRLVSRMISSRWTRQAKQSLP